MHVGYSIFDLNIKGPRRGHVIKVTQLQILVKPNYAGGLTSYKTRACAAPCLGWDVGVWGSLCLRPCLCLLLPIWADLAFGSVRNCFGAARMRVYCIASVSASVMDFFFPLTVPLPQHPLSLCFRGRVWGLVLVLSQHSRLGPQRVCISVPPPASMQPDLCRNQWLPINEELIYIFISTWEQRRAFSYWDSSGHQWPVVSAGKKLLLGCLRWVKPLVRLILCTVRLGVAKIYSHG